MALMQTRNYVKVKGGNMRSQHATLKDLLHAAQEAYMPVFRRLMDIHGAKRLSEFDRQLHQGALGIVIVRLRELESRVKELEEETKRTSGVAVSSPVVSSVASADLGELCRNQDKSQ
jgi:hypothetical protein